VRTLSRVVLGAVGLLVGAIMGSLASLVLAVLVLTAVDQWWLRGAPAEEGDPYWVLILLLLCGGGGLILGGIFGAVAVIRASRPPTTTATRSGPIPDGPPR
jgi:hypothetical protein